MHATDRARKLRRDSSRAKKICWNLIRDRRIDGEHHAYQLEADARRTAAMEKFGWQVVRFWANEVVANPEGFGRRSSRC